MVALIQNEKHYTSHPIGATPNLCVQVCLQRVIKLFFSSAIKLLNSLPESVVQARDVEELKTQITDYYS